MAANLWLSSSANQTIYVDDTVTLTAYLDPSTISSSSTSSYRAKIMIDGSVKGSSSTWSVSGSRWVTSCSYTFTSTGSYAVGIALCNSRGSYLGYETGTITVRVKESTYTLDITYITGSTYKSQTITGQGTIQDGSIFSTPSGYAFYGWATNYGTTSISSTYAAGKSYTPTSNQSIDLYAVWIGERDITCYYGVNMASANYRTATSYMYNSSDTVRTTKSGTITLPNFNPSTITALSRTFTGIGWRSDTKAASQTCNPGTTITPTSDVYYAVYDNNDGIKVTYDSNGGSGTMASATVSGTLYYNTAGNNTTITVNPRDCTFTPPKGKSFAGWSTSANGNIVTAISTAYNVTFYAIWQSSLPAIWTWSSTIGGTLELTPTGDNTYDVYPLTAIEWNNFLSRIEEWVDVLGTTLWVSDIQVATATKGSEMKASQAQAVVRLLKNLNPPTSPPNAPSSGGAITASFINGLATSLNSLRSLYA